MKKLSLLLIISMFLFVGCSSTKKVPVVVKKTIFEQTEIAVNENVNYSILSVEKFAKKDYSEAKAGYEYVVVKVRIENKSDKKVSYNSFDWKLQNSKGQEEDATYLYATTDTEIGSGDLLSNGVVEGTMAWEQPIADKGLMLNYYASMFDSKSVFQIKIN